MQDYAEYADDVVERIDAGELDPTEVDIQPFIEDETKVLTPELADRLDGTGKIEEYNARWSQRANREVAAREREEAGESRDLLSSIRRTVVEGPSTDTVEFDFLDEPVEVKLDPPGKVFDAVEIIDSLGDGETDGRRMGELRDTLIDAGLSVIVDGPEALTDREGWVEFYEAEGPGAVADVVFVLTEPAREAQERMQSFRGGPPVGRGDAPHDRGGGRHAE